MKLTYRTLPYDEDDDAMPATEDKNTESAAVVRADCHHRSRWDDDCPWSEWYSADDPVKGEMVSVAFAFLFCVTFAVSYCPTGTYDNKRAIVLVCILYVTSTKMEHDSCCSLNFQRDATLGSHFQRKSNVLMVVGVLSCICIAGI